MDCTFYQSVKFTEKRIESACEPGFERQANQNLGRSMHLMSFKQWKSAAGRIPDSGVLLFLSGPSISIDQSFWWASLKSLEVKDQLSSFGMKEVGGKPAKDRFERILRFFKIQNQRSMLAKNLQTKSSSRVDLNPAKLQSGLLSVDSADRIRKTGHQRNWKARV